MKRINGEIQFKHYNNTEARKLRWKKFGKANESDNDSITTVCDEVKLVLRYPRNNYANEDSILAINKEIDDSISYINRQQNKEKRKNNKIEEKNTNSNNYKVPSKQKNSNIQKILDEQKHKCNIVVTDINELMHDEIMEIFSKFGNIEKIHTINYDNSQYVRIAFIHYSNQTQAQAAIDNMNKKPINSILIRVEYPYLDRK